MGIFKDYSDIGKNGPSEKFLKVYKDKAQYHTYSTKAYNMINGAIAAFYEGRPENVQAAMANEKSIRSYNYWQLAPNVLFKITEKTNEKLANINLAVAKIPEQDRKEFLSTALNNAFGNNIGNEVFYSTMLQAGADANASIDGHAGALLVTAACNKQPISVIKLLYDNGASFDDALTTMHSQGHETADIDRLKFFEEKVTGSKPAPAKAEPAVQPIPVAVTQDADVRELLVLILEQMTEITKRLPPPPAEQPVANTTQPQPAKAPQGKKSYPAVKGL